MSELVAGATIEASAVEVPAAPAAPVGGPPVAATELELFRTLPGAISWPR